MADVVHHHMGAVLSVHRVEHHCASFPPIHSHKPSTHSHIQTASVEVGSHRWNTRTHTMLNLLSDESDEEQDGEHVYSPCCRHDLYTTQAKLAGPDGGRLPFRGLFASKSLCVRAFVGFYTGEGYTPETLESMPDARRRSEYAVSTSGDARCDEIICSPPVERRRIDEVKYPVGLANEPGKYSTANCMLVEY